MEKMNAGIYIYFSSENNLLDSQKLFDMVYSPKKYEDFMDIIAKNILYNKSFCDMIKKLE